MDIGIYDFFFGHTANRRLFKKKRRKIEEFFY